MGWQIKTQEEKVGREVVQVKCKNVRMFPIEQGGQVVGFGKLGFLLLQVIVVDEKGDERKLKLSTYRGIHDPKFTVQYPDKLVYKTYFTGQGKTRKEWADTLSQKVVKKGEKEEYDLPDFEKRLKGMVGAGLAEEIMQEFLARFGKLAA